MKRVAVVLVLALGVSLSLALVAPLVQADAVWGKHVVDNSLDGANDVDVGDIDGDGNPDVVAAGYLADAIMWYEASNDPTQSWLEHSIAAGLNGTHSVFVYDIDGDHNLDVAATGELSGSIVWYEAPDDPVSGTWTANTVDAGLTGARDVFVYDIDGANGPDIVATAYDVGNAGSPDVVWYEDDSNAPNWTRHVVDAGLAGARGVYVYDIDGDNDPDVVAAGEQDDDVIWYEAPPDPIDPWTKRTIDGNLGGAWGVYVADIDDDTNPDVVATGSIADDVVWYEAPDDPVNAWTKRTIDGDFDDGRGIYVADVDQDGNTDVAVAGHTVDDVVWYEAPDDPTASWMKHTVDGSADGAMALSVYDIDGDTGLDIVAAAYMDDDVIWYEAPTEPAEGWVAYTIDSAPAQTRHAFVHDIDGDGNPDVAVTAYTDDDVVWYEAPDNPVAAWTEHTIDGGLDGASDLFAYDIDGDDNPDVVVAGLLQDDIAWYEAPDDPTSAWTRHWVYDDGASVETERPRDVFVYDVDEDGNPDVVATLSQATAAGDVVWFEAPDDPTAAWTKHIIDADLDEARGVFVYDMDGDGDPDVVAAGQTPDAIVWYEAPDDPTGAWTEHTIDNALDGAWGVSARDIDGDDSPDVVATGSAAGDVVWYKAPEDPTSVPWRKITIDGNLDNVREVFVADVDGDNNLDVIATGYAVDDVVWYEAPNDPILPWSKHTIDGSLDGAWGLHAGDIDGDDDPDVVAAGALSGDVKWYVNPRTQEGCFIATAAYGTDTGEGLDVLRSFRDDVLGTSMAGRALTSTYYATSPPIAEAMAGNPVLRGATRVLLVSPLSYGARTALSTAAVGLAIVCFGGLLFLLRGRRPLRAMLLGVLTASLLASMVFVLGYSAGTLPVCASVAAYLLPWIVPSSVGMALLEVARNPDRRPAIR